LRRNYQSGNAANAHIDARDLFAGRARQPAETGANAAPEGGTAANHCTVAILNRTTVHLLHEGGYANGKKNEPATLLAHVSIMYWRNDNFPTGATSARSVLP